MLVNKTSYKYTGKLGQKVDKTKCGHNYKIILPIRTKKLELVPIKTCPKIKDPCRHSVL